MTKAASHRQSGNMLIYIIGAIFLLGILIVLVKGSFQEGVGIDGDKMVIQVSQVQQYGAELERGVNYILRNNYSESDIRFAWNNSSTYGTPSDLPGRQVFMPEGGGVEYKAPPANVNDGTDWQFSATTHLTQLGSGSEGTPKAELLAVLPKVTQNFCSQVNRAAGQNIDLTQTTASGDCVYEAGDEFNGTYAQGSVNLLDDTKLGKIPAKEACIKCSDGNYYYYRVLLVR